eukprot:7270607-Prymnesium_polylepis.1
MKLQQSAAWISWVEYTHELHESKAAARRSVSRLLHQRLAAALASWTSGATVLRDTRAALRSGLGHLLHRE